MFTPVCRSERPGLSAAILLQTACLTLVVAALLTPSAEAKYTAKAANDLVSLINKYRQQNKLPAIPLSQKLTQVAKAHMEDLANNQPHIKLCGPDKQNPHSWSPNGSKWKGGCYDGENQATWPIMWDKPKEITGYPSKGYEISNEGSSTAHSALSSWKGSTDHNEVILNKDIWSGYNWQAIGAAQCNGYWCVWFGKTLDNSPPPNKIAYLKGYNRPRTVTWLSDLLAIDPSKFKLIASGDSGSGKKSKGSSADAGVKASPSGSRVSAGVHGRVYALNPDGTLHGTVTGATIELKSQAGAAISRIQSGANGYYKADLPAGRYFYKVTAPGYKDEDEGRGFQLQRTDEGHIYDFWLVKGVNDPEKKPPEIPATPIGKLKGTVWEKTSEGELVGIPHAIVSLRQSDSVQIAKVGTRASDTDEETTGAYQIVLAQGTWRASVAAAGFDTLVDPLPIEIVPGGEATRDFILARRAPEPPVGQGIKGVVRVEGQRIGHLPPDLKVVVADLPAMAAIVPLDVAPAGTFQRDLAPGVYRVKAAASGYVPASSSAKYVLAGQYTVVTLVLRKQEEPKPETPEDPVTPAVPETPDTPDVPDSPDEPDTPDVPETPETPDTPDGPERPDDSIQATLQVHVVGVDGRQRRPLAGARVLIRFGDQSLTDAQQKTTNESGVASFQITQPGQHVALAQMRGYRPGGVELEIGANEKITKTIILQRQTRPDGSAPVKPPPGVNEGEEAEPVQVAGYVIYSNPRSPTGAFGVRGARLTWRRIDDGRPTPAHGASTGRIGDFSLVLTEGQYEVTFELPDKFQPKPPERLVVALGMKPKWFTVEKRAFGEPDGSIRPPDGSWTDPEGQPNDEMIPVRGYVVTRSPRLRGGYAAVGGATVHWYPRSGQRVEPGVARSDRRGRFSVNLYQGDYVAEVAPPPGYERTRRDIRVTQGMERPMLVVRRSEQGMGPPPGGPIEPPPGIEQQPPGDSRSANLYLQVYGRDRGRAFPLAGCQVRVSQGRRTLLNGGTDGRGTFQTRLGNGSYQVTVVKGGYNMGRTGVELRGRDVTRRIYLDRQPGRQPGDPGRPTQPPPPQNVSLHVRVMVTFPRPPKPGRPGGFATTPAGGANVTIVQNGRQVATGTTDGGGNYTARLRSGGYQIRVTHGNIHRAENVTLGRTNVSRTITLQSGAAAVSPQQPGRPGVQILPLRPGLQIRPLGPLKVLPAQPKVTRPRVR